DMRCSWVKEIQGTRDGRSPGRPTEAGGLIYRGGRKGGLLSRGVGVGAASRAAPAALGGLTPPAQEAPPDSRGLPLSVSLLRRHPPCSRRATAELAPAFAAGPAAAPGAEVLARKGTTSEAGAKRIRERRRGSRAPGRQGEKLWTGGQESPPGWAGKW